MFERYEELAKEQYPEFKFDFGKMDYLPFAYKIPNGYVGCVFTHVNPIIDDHMFFMVNTQGMK